MSVLRFLTLLACAVALAASLATLAVPAYSVIFAVTAAIAVGIAMVAVLITPRGAATTAEIGRAHV